MAAEAGAASPPARVRRRHPGPPRRRGGDATTGWCTSTGPASGRSRTSRRALIGAAVSAETAAWVASLGRRADHRRPAARRAPAGARRLPRAPADAGRPRCRCTCRTPPTTTTALADRPRPVAQRTRSGRRCAGTRTRSRHFDAIAERVRPEDLREAGARVERPRPARRLARRAGRPRLRRRAPPPRRRRSSRSSSTSSAPRCCPQLDVDAAVKITDTSDVWWKTAVVYCLDVETFLDCGRRRHRRHRRARAAHRLPRRPRRHVPLADALLPHPRPRRRLRHHRLLRRRPAAREPRRLRRAGPHRPRPGDAGHRRPRREPHLGPPPVVPRRPGRAAPRPYRDWYVWTDDPPTTQADRRRLPGPGDEHLDLGREGRVSTTSTASTATSPT